MTFALCFCNRGFMPGKLIYGTQEAMIKAVTDAWVPASALSPCSLLLPGTEGSSRKTSLTFLIWRTAASMMC